MINELNMLKVQIEIEMEFHGKESGVTVAYYENTGEYSDHFIKYDSTRSAPNVIQQMILGLKLYHCTLDELYNAVLHEMDARFEVEHG